MDDEDGIIFFDEDVPNKNRELISKQKNDVKTEKEKSNPNSNNVKTDKDKDKKKDKQKEENSFDLEDEYYELDGF